MFWDALGLYQLLNLIDRSDFCLLDAIDSLDAFIRLEHLAGFVLVGDGQLHGVFIHCLAELLLLAIELARVVENVNVNP